MGMSLSKGKEPKTPVTAELRQQKPQFSRKSSILVIPIRDINADFKMGNQIGSGKFAVTYLCREKSTGKKFACKSIPKKRLVTDSEKEDLKREVSIMEHLKGQPNVVELKDKYEDNKSVHLVMEYCKGGELYGKMEAKGKYPEKIAAQILSSIMKVVFSLHYMGVMHRDLKPENFMLPEKGAFGFVPCFADYTTLKAIDFGLSAYIDEVNQEKVGTAFYVAPEVLLRQVYGEKVDIWSGGVILYMLLTGVPPFYGDNDKEIFGRILKRNLDMENHPWPSISENAKKLVEKMLSLDPTKRPTAAQVLNDQWLIDNGVATENPTENMFVDKMKHFRAMNKFKKLALKIMTEVIPQQELEGLKAMFDNFETDEKKAITRDELEKSLVKLGSNLKPEEVKQIAEAADADKNGSIDYDEFMIAIMNFQRQHKAEDLRNAFKRFDKDNNKLISKEELRATLEEYKMGDEATIEEIIADIDANDDGEISYEEFCEMIRS